MKTKDQKSLKEFFDEKVNQYNRISFIKDDPVCIPHLFNKKADIEIAGLFAAVFAWGNRTTIIQKSKELMQLMGNTPHEFCLNHSDKDLQILIHFKHRTFNTTDLLYFIEFLKYHYTNHKITKSPNYQITKLPNDQITRHNKKKLATFLQQAFLNNKIILCK